MKNFIVAVIIFSLFLGLLALAFALFASIWDFIPEYTGKIAGTGGSSILVCLVITFFYGIIEDYEIKKKKSFPLGIQGYNKNISNDRVYESRDEDH